MENILIEKLFIISFPEPSSSGLWLDWGPVKRCGQWALSIHVYLEWVQQCGEPRPAPIMQSRQSRGRPSNTKCLINLLICCDCRAWKACFFAIWGQKNPVLCYTHMHTHLRHGLLSCCGGIKTDSPFFTLDYLHERTTRGQASYWPLNQLR